MSLVEFNWKPTDRQLRQFGVACAFVLPLIGWVWSVQTSTVGILAVIGMIIAAIGWIKPRLIVPAFLGLSIIATPIGMVAGELVMLLVYGIVFLPMGLCFRFMGRDALDRKSASADSYWRPVPKPKNIASYYRQS